MNYQTNILKVDIESVMKKSNEKSHKIGNKYQSIISKLQSLHLRYKRLNSNKKRGTRPTIHCITYFLRRLFLRRLIHVGLNLTFFSELFLMTHPSDVIRSSTL